MNRKSRRWIYNAFENAHLPIDHIIRIGKIIHHDFSEEIDELKGKPQPAEDLPFIYKEPKQDAEYWRTKYYELLEKYNALLEGRLGM